MISYTFYPHNYTFLHFFAILGKGELLDRALKMDSPYLIDADGRSPLSYAISNRTYPCIDKLMNYLASNPQKMILTEDDFLEVFSSPVGAVKTLT